MEGNKKLFARIGMSCEVTDNEYENLKQLMQTDENAAAEWLYEKFKNCGSFDGESYLPVYADDNPNTEDFVF